MNIIQKYNETIYEIVDNFARRFYKEIYDEDEDEYEFDLMDYEGIKQWPIEIWEEYYSLDDIILAEHLQIPTKVVQNYNEYNLELYEQWKEKDCNLYSYYKKWLNTDQT